MGLGRATLWIRVESGRRSARGRRPDLQTEPPGRGQKDWEWPQKGCGRGLDKALQSGRVGREGGSRVVGVTGPIFDPSWTLGRARGRGHSL